MLEQAIGSAKYELTRSAPQRPPYVGGRRLSASTSMAQADSPASHSMGVGS